MITRNEEGAYLVKGAEVVSMGDFLRVLQYYLLEGSLYMIVRRKA